jgi:hypothetical protein
MIKDLNFYFPFIARFGSIFLGMIATFLHLPMHDCHFENTGHKGLPMVGSRPRGCCVVAVGSQFWQREPTIALSLAPKHSSNLSAKLSILPLLKQNFKVNQPPKVLGAATIFNFRSLSNTSAAQSELIRPDFSFSYTLPSNCIVGLLQGGASDLFLQSRFDELLRVLFPIK